MGQVAVTLVCQRVPLLLGAGPPPGANMGMGMMNPDMLGMMPQHDVGMGFDMSAGSKGPCTLLSLPVYASGSMKSAE